MIFLMKHSKNKHGICFSDTLIIHLMGLPSVASIFLQKSKKKKTHNMVTSFFFRAENVPLYMYLFYLSTLLLLNAYNKH